MLCLVGSAQDMIELSLLLLISFASETDSPSVERLMMLRLTLTGKDSFASAFIKYTQSAISTCLFAYPRGAELSPTSLCVAVNIMPVHLGEAQHSYELEGRGERGETVTSQAEGGTGIM